MSSLDNCFRQGEDETCILLTGAFEQLGRWQFVDSSWVLCIEAERPSSHMTDSNCISGSSSVWADGVEFWDYMRKKGHRGGHGQMNWAFWTQKKTDIRDCERILELCCTRFRELVEQDIEISRFWIAALCSTHDIGLCDFWEYSTASLFRIYSKLMGLFQAATPQSTMS